MEVVATFSSRSEAEMAQQMLLAQGIPVLLSGDDGAGALPYLAMSTGGYSLAVDPEHAEAAVQALLPPQDEAAPH